MSGPLPGEAETALVEVGGSPPYLDAVSQRKPVMDGPGGGFTHSYGKDGGSSEVPDGESNWSPGTEDRSMEKSWICGKGTGERMSLGKSTVSPKTTR